MKRIETLREIVEAARKRKALVCPAFAGFRKPKPAAFVVNQSGAVLARMIDDGLFVYEKQKTNREKLMEFGKYGELAIKRCDELGPINGQTAEEFLNTVNDWSKEKSLNNAFGWVDSKEGYQVWLGVWDGRPPEMPENME